MSNSVLVWAHNYYQQAESLHELQLCDAMKAAHGQRSQQVISGQRWPAKHVGLFVNKAQIN